MKLKVGDTVCLLNGDEKDKYVVDKKGVKTRKTGKVLKILHSEDKVIVEGFNMIKKHQRARTEQESGKILDTEAPIHVSNLALVDPKTGAPTRIGYKEVNGAKVRYAKKSGELLDKPQVKKPAKKGAK